MGRTKQWVIIPWSFEIFLIFCSAAHGGSRIYQFVTNNHASFHLWCKICSAVKSSENIMNIIVGAKLQVKQTILKFCTKFAQKEPFPSKKEKISITIEISVFSLLTVPNFMLNRQFSFTGPNLLKKGRTYLNVYCK